MSTETKAVATVNNPTIEAIVNEFFRLASKEQAIERLETIKEYFIVSKDQEEDQSDPSVRLWIKGYAVTPGQEEKGGLGNFALVKCRQTPRGKWMLYAIREEVEVNKHPQKRRPKQRHPNFGHPLLRMVKKKTVFASVEEARALFQRLHEEFPAISIPCTNKMYIMVYSRQHEGNPVQKYVLHIKVADKGGFIIEVEENTYDGAKKKPVVEMKSAPGTLPKDQPKAAVGKFSSMVQLKKKPTSMPIQRVDENAPQPKVDPVAAAKADGAKVEVAEPQKDEVTEPA